MTKSSQTIPERRVAAEQAIREAEGELLIARAMLTAVQTACPHPNGTRTRHTDYGGGTDTYFSCPDCGMSKCL